MPIFVGGSAFYWSNLIVVHKSEFLNILSKGKGLWNLSLSKKMTGIKGKETTFCALYAEASPLIVILC